MRQLRSTLEKLEEMLFTTAAMAKEHARQERKLKDDVAAYRELIRETKAFQADASREPSSEGEAASAVTHRRAGARLQALGPERGRGQPHLSRRRRAATTSGRRSC